MHRNVAAFMSALILAGFSSANAQIVPVSPGTAGYTCCNLHFEGDWISDANWTTLPFIPAGARIELKEYGRFRAFTTIDGRPMRVGQDYGRLQESKEQFLGKLIVKDDPKLKIATWPPAVQAAIRAGKVMPGMTQEQVIISLGYPRTDETYSLEEAEWKYRTFENEHYLIVWGKDKLVKDIDATRAVKRAVTYAAQE